MNKWVLGVIGGSGLYQIDGVKNGRWEAIASPWGAPSDEVYRGEVGSVGLVFLHAMADIIGSDRRNSTIAPTSTC